MEFESIIIDFSHSSHCIRTRERSPLHYHRYSFNSRRLSRSRAKGWQTTAPRARRKKYETLIKIYVMQNIVIHKMSTASMGAKKSTEIALWEKLLITYPFFRRRWSLSWLVAMKSRWENERSISRKKAP